MYSIHRTCSSAALCLMPDCRRDGSAVFDFTGTGPQLHGNLNAPPAVAASAVIYSLRCMVTRDIPLNQGCLAPIQVPLPARCAATHAAACPLCCSMEEKLAYILTHNTCCCFCAPQIVIPQQCLLNPSPSAAVVGGNVLTSQRVTDVVLKAFGAAAASQVGMPGCQGG